MGRFLSQNSLQAGKSDVVSRVRIKKKGPQKRRGSFINTYLITIPTHAELHSLPAGGKPLLDPGFEAGSLSLSPFYS